MTPPPPPSTPTPDPVHGKALYSTAPAGVSLACSACHGNPPDAPARRAANDPGLLTSAFTSAGGMNTYLGKYSAQDLIDLAAYLAGPTY
ncbi:MAG: cytochrome c [Burkholderiaceae bacterium]|nr:cytochrome c [Burkholderiaceae bacterium]